MAYTDKHTKMFTQCQSQENLPLREISQGFTQLSSWISSLKQGAQTYPASVEQFFTAITRDEPAPEVTQVTEKTLPDLTSLLGQPVHDVDFYGSVPDFIQKEIDQGRNASFLVTDLTSVVKQYD